MLLRGYDRSGLRGMLQNISGPTPNDPFGRLIENLVKNIDDFNRQSLTAKDHTVH